MNRQKLFHGDCLDVLKTMESDSVDSLVTDPPAGIAFMGKDWDKDKGGRTEWVSWMRDVMREVHRVLKPGAHGLVWALPRTSHWTAMALEDAGFEIRDSIYHIFGSGFPKSLDVSKAIDKAAGVEREVVGLNQHAHKRTGAAKEGTFDNRGPGLGGISSARLTAPATDEAKQWHGFGTALKPAVECWWLVRKPLGEKTVAKNVLKHGTGALNIDASRIDGKPRTTHSCGNIRTQDNLNGRYSGGMPLGPYAAASGRFPSHLVLSHSIHCTTVLHHDRETDGMSDTQHCVSDCPINEIDRQGWPNWSNGVGPSRFFYCAKISTRERNAGMDDKTNGHPTVKPQKLMRYLITMITPPGGTVLDPFTGSGSTGCAAVADGFKFIGIERDAEYVAIAEKRIFNSFPKAEKQLHLGE